MNKWHENELLDQLALLKKEDKVYQWKVSSNELNRKEFYLIQDPTHKVGLDQARWIGKNSHYVTMFVKKDEKTMGESRQQVYTDKELAPQLAEILASAHLSTKEFWALPDEPMKVKNQATTMYGPFEQDLSVGATQVCDDFQKAIQTCEKGIFNSAELFVSTEKNKLQLSNGFAGESSHSKIFSEVCFSHYNPAVGKSEEFLLTENGAHPEQINFVKMCEDSALYAEKSLGTDLPTSGPCPVIVSADVLCRLFLDLTHQLHGWNKYIGLPYLEKGQELIPEFSGTPFKVYLDPHVDYAYGSESFDPLGLCGEKTLIIENNQVQDNIMGYPTSQYLKTSPNISGGNIVVEAAGMPLDELRKQGDQVLEILQFSGLFSNADNLTFSSEIRLARHYNNKTGEIKFIKGGNLSGNIKENFKGIQFSDELNTQNVMNSFAGEGMAFVGPSHALLNDVSLSS